MLEAQLEKRVGGLQVRVSLQVAEGQTMAIVGPTGCGKTTTLMMIAGLMRPDRGRITFNGHTLFDSEKEIDVPPERRNIGVVFQSHALFPHLSVFDNVAYGLRARGFPRREIERKVESITSVLGLKDLAQRRPRELSGGESQRVALARALVFDPPVLMLDEPLAALDLQTRHEVRRELRQVLRRFGKTTIVVTHDPIDALTLGSTICVLENGEVRQVGDRHALLAEPKSQFVAQFMGVNFFRGIARSVTGEGLTEVEVAGQKVFTAERVSGETALTFLPSEVTVAREPPRGSALNVFRGEVSEIIPLGDRVRLSVDAGIPIVAEITAHSFASLAVSEASPVYVAFKATAVRQVE